MASPFDERTTIQVIRWPTMNLLEKLQSIRPEDLDRDAAEFFRGVSFDHEGFHADGETVAIPKMKEVAEMVLARQCKADEPLPQRIKIEDL